MNKTTKRPAKYTDYRARSPKRRKLDGADRKPDLDRRTQVDILLDPEINTARRHRSEKDSWYKVRAILSERGTGRKTEYEVDWEGTDSVTGKPYPPSWEPPNNITKDLVKAWKAKKKGKQPHRADDYTPSQTRTPIPPTRGAHSDGIAVGGPVRRPKRPRRILEESSSDIEADTILVSTRQRGSITPALDSDTASTPVDDFVPGSPSLEILESQHQTSDVPDFSLRIPPRDIDRSEYESYHSSQVPYSIKSPESSAAPLSDLRSLRSSGILNRPAVSSPLALASSQHQNQNPTSSDSIYIAKGTNGSHRDQLLQAAHQKLLGAVVSSSASNPPSSQPKVQIPVSSETDHPQQGTSSQPRKQSQIIKSSLSLGESGTKRRGPSRVPPAPPRNRQKSSHPFFSSAQQVSQFPESQESALLKSLQSLNQSQLDLPSSSPSWRFQSQSVPHAILSQGKSRLEEAGHRGRPRKKSRPKMDLSPVRQSPRLRASTPVKNAQSPRLAPKEQTYQDHTPQEGDEAVSPQQIRMPSNTPFLSVQDQSAGSSDSRSKPTSTPSFSSAQAYAQESSFSTENPSEQQTYDPAYGASALPIQQSIEEEPPSSAEEASIASKASSSQASLENERVVPQVDGVSLPLHPVLGPAEYTIALPAEGKIQSAYADTIKAKRKTVVKFINRRDSVGSANGSNSRTQERNDMIGLIERLHDITTHFDLGLPGFATQYSVRSEEHAAFAKYAGAKFVFLGCLVEALVKVDCSVVIASKAGPVQQLIEEFLVVKQVHVTRHDRPTSARSTTPDLHQKTLKIDLVDTTSDIDIHLSPRPLLLIAFDASFDNQSPQIRRIRELNSRGRNQLLPVVHLLTSNSSEDIDRCLRKTMPSPQRLKLLVRGTYQAKGNLGGSPTYVPEPSDAPEGRQMNVHDLQRAVRKSPNRRLNMMAHIIARAAITEDFEQYWTLGAMPEVQYEELEDTPPKLSERSTVAGTANATPRDGRALSRTPISRAGTPSGKKRLLDPDDFRIQSVLSKRQRMSPLRDVTPMQEPPKEPDNEVDLLRDQIKSLEAELAHERQAKLKAYADLEHEKTKSADWEKSHNIVMQRYDTRRIKQHRLDKENKRLQGLVDSAKEKQDKVMQSNTNLKEQVAQLKTDLTTAREELKSSTVPEVAAIEAARSEARIATAKAVSLEKQLENKNQDFEFTRQQYQQASTRAAELGQQNRELEADVETLKGQASDEKRRLRQVNIDEATKQDRRRIDQLEQENKVIEKLLKKTKEEVEVLRKGRGVQTRGSSVQPPGSPGIVGVGTRSRQGSPAPHVMSSAADARRDLHQAHVHANNRISGLRNER